MIPAWLLTRVIRLVVGTLHSQDVTFCNSSVDLWENFVESSAVQQLVMMEQEMPVEHWQEQLHVAFRLCRDMEREDALDMTKVYPILCCLITGTHCAEQSLPGVVVVPQESSFLLHALVGIESLHSCPDSIVHWVLEKHPEQLDTKGPGVDGQLPLAIACSRPSDYVTTILHAHPHAASISDSKGRYPLHLACQTAYLTWESGIRELFLSAPQVLLIPTADGTSVFLAMALGLAESPRGAKRCPSMELSHLETLFQLLRADPTVVRAYILCSS
jgi:hypothetical protein